MELPVTERGKEKIAYELQILTTKSYAFKAKEGTNISTSPREGGKTARTARWLTVARQ